ncbi:predicted protein [Brucella abortus bv. 4 str. 292]|uniref:Uncharacterized protein n=8 Tax=Brucella TaxID=234 RepID=A0A0H3GD54_BRUSU|nr:hypothetical protein BR1784 [Brucella suis 1330]ACU48752.1 hypothetical protein BMI_I1802 [Brucella microti CCM 4915]AEK55077.1 hypothetical protein BPI_I1842 [Brucella pinnipedialis B2/94]AEU06768.1 hypothetical protein BSVBI22_A1780 [Brucella suis VBI22]AHN47376.1 hypothetical protein BSS2_I1727 [Brucella suis bv. 1 str. S2]EEX55956.1 predicted protein [Brucella abortus bv. 4 str. 292]EEX59779.1 predicted protein [Brucella abortus bv. 2 str. 86/8/59]EEX62404.1 predicted protein [Brucell
MPGSPMLKPLLPPERNTRARFYLIESDWRSPCCFDALLIRKSFHTFRDAL